MVTKSNADMSVDQNTNLENGGVFSGFNKVTFNNDTGESVTQFGGYGQDKH